PSAVLLPHDGRDGRGAAAGRRGDGDAGRQRTTGRRADYAGGSGEGLALCHPRRRTHGGRGHGVGDYQVRVDRDQATVSSSRPAGTVSLRARSGKKKLITVG